MQKQLPKDWKLVKLGEALDIQGGSQPPKSNFKYEPSNGYIQLLQIRDFGEKGVATFVPKNKVTKFCKKDDIMIARYGASLGRIMTGLEGAYNVAMAKVIDEKKLFEKRYIFYLLKTQIFQTPLKLLSRSAQNGFSKSEIAHILLPLPPLPTQLAIVSKIEELFSELDKGIENLRTAQQQLKTYRQAVLKWAFEGKLTNEKVEDGVLPEGWKTLELGSVCSLITDGKHGDCDNEENSGFYFLSAKDVRNNTLLWANARQITKAGFEETHRRTNLKPGDICLVNTGATIGRISIAPNDERTYKSTFQKSVAVIKCIPDLIDNKYCKYLLQGDLKKLVKVSSGTAVPNLLLGTLKGHLINLPPTLEEENYIVQEIESRLSVADKMEESISQSLQQAEALRQSILKKAFEGKLIN